MSDFKRHSSGSTFEAEYGYARAVADQDYIHVSGTTGYNYADMTIDPDPATQAEQCLTNIQEALAVFNAALSDVVRVHYLSEILTILSCARQCSNAASAPILPPRP